MHNIVQSLGKIAQKIVKIKYPLSLNENLRENCENYLAFRHFTLFLYSNFKYKYTKIVLKKYIKLQKSIKRWYHHSLPSSYNYKKRIIMNEKC